MTCLPQVVAVLVASAILALGSCTHLNRPDFEELAGQLNVSKISAKGHQLWLLSNQISRENQANVNIYLEGDGRPWRNRTQINDDPSPRYPLALHLMSVDPNPAWYLTRPCYHGLGENCQSDLWTWGRYSEEVVDSMAAALTNLLATIDSQKNVTLLGYSGGATLALLLAERVQDIDSVVTVAGNLDIDAWTERHGYTPLHRSLNPAQQKLPRHVRYLHYAGSEDRNIPPTLGQAVHSQPGHHLEVIEGFDHRCCWVERWPAILEELYQQ